MLLGQSAATPSEWRWGGAVLQKTTGPSVETRQSMQASYKNCKLVRDKHGGNSLSNTSVLHMNLQTYRLQWFVTAWASVTTQTAPFKQKRLVFFGLLLSKTLSSRQLSGSPDYTQGDEWRCLKVRCPLMSHTSKALSLSLGVTPWLWDLACCRLLYSAVPPGRHGRNPPGEKKEWKKPAFNSKK